MLTVKIHEIHCQKVEIHPLRMKDTKSTQNSFNNNNNNNSRISIPPSVVTSEAVAEPVRSRKSAIVG